MVRGAGGVRRRADLSTKGTARGAHRPAKIARAAQTFLLPECGDCATLTMYNYPKSAHRYRMQFRAVYRILLSLDPINLGAMGRICAGAEGDS